MKSPMGHWINRHSNRFQRRFLQNGLRPHSPLSPKMRNMAATKAGAEDSELSPAKELEQLVNKVKFGLKHFCDVISKQKLEMLPGNSNIVLDDIANIHRAIKPYCGKSASLASGVQRLCESLAALIQLCDEATGAHRDRAESALAPTNVARVVEGVRAAVHEVTTLALQHMARPALSPRPALVCHRRPNSQRNSLPDIPLTPKERSLLTGGTGGGGGLVEGGVRASHSSESVLDAPDPPPPKPPRPNRKVGQAPPLPPKRKSNDQSLVISTDRVSLQSHSSGSLDSMLNVSHDDEVRAIMDHSGSADDSLTIVPPCDILAVCSCGGSGDVRTLLDAANTNGTHTNVHTHTNHNRFSNESGFVSMNQNSAVWSDVSSFSSRSTAAFAELSQFNCSSNSVFEARESVTELRSFERRVNVASSTAITSMAHTNGCSTVHPTVSISSVSSTEDGVDGAPPALPVKTRRSLRSEINHHFPDIDIRQKASCALHGEPRPHTLADTTRPPPLPLKKKHIMAYMEMFGNCSHPPAAPPAPSELFRHSIHSYNLASNNLQVGGTMPTGAQISFRQVQHKAIAQSVTLHHLSTGSRLSSSSDSVSVTPTEGGSPLPPVPPPLPIPPALPPKMSKIKQQLDSLPIVLEPRPLSSSSVGSHSNTSGEDLHSNNMMSEYVITTPGKFPLEDEFQQMVHLTPSPTPSKVGSASGTETEAEPRATAAETSETDIILFADVSGYLLHNTDEDGPDVQGGHPDALVVHALKNTKDFSYGEALLATYRTWMTSHDLVSKLIRRARHFKARPHDFRPTVALFTRVVADLTHAELDEQMLQSVMEFVCWLVCSEELLMARELRHKLLDKQSSIAAMARSVWDGYGPYASTSLRRDTLLDFKACELAEQMTLLDAALFTRITTAEVLLWPCEQSEERSPNLTRFTEHFNKMSYWARSRILMQEEARERERYIAQLLKVMKYLRKINNFNSYLALLSAIECAPIRRLNWPRALVDSIKKYTTLIDSTGSFKYYRQVLAETHPPCIPYLGLVLQDLTFVHNGNPSLLPDGSINFCKRWQQYQIIENMNKFYMGQYTIKKNESIIAMFNGFDDVLSEEAMWQISESLKPPPARAHAPPPARTHAPPPARAHATPPAPALTTQPVLAAQPAT